MLFPKKPTPPPRQSHSMTLRFKHLEASGQGWGIVGVIIVVTILVLGSAFCAPLAVRVASNLIPVAQVEPTPAKPPPDASPNK